MRLIPQSDFNPRSPCGERRRYCLIRSSTVYFNPRSPCGERPHYNSRACPRVLFQSTLPVRGATAGRDPIGGYYCSFQSTLPVRGATLTATDIVAPPPNFNPRSPCGERRRACGLRLIPQSDFNPRSPCGERPPTEQKSLEGLQFQSTLPVRGATAASYWERRGATISIHAPRAGSDALPSKCVATQGYFNPRSPCGERLYSRKNIRVC